MLAEFLEVSEDETNRICYLIAHHHTYDNVEGLDYRILLEADFLVNAMEDDLDTKKWTQTIRNWASVYGELCIMYEGRLPE